MLYNLLLHITFEVNLSSKGNRFNHSKHIFRLQKHILHTFCALKLHLNSSNKCCKTLRKQSKRYTSLITTSRTICIILKLLGIPSVWHNNIPFSAFPCIPTCFRPTLNARFHSFNYCHKLLKHFTVTALCNNSTMTIKK